MYVSDTVNTVIFAHETVRNCKSPYLAWGEIRFSF